MSSKFIKYFVVLVVIAYVTIGLFVSIYSGRQWVELGQIGDYWGGIANSVALLGIFVALLVQRNELNETLQHSRELSQCEMVLEYYRDGDCEKQQSARNVVYNTSPEALVGTRDAEVVVTYFHTWGMFVKKGAMPPWVFLETTTKDRVLTLYDKLIPHIVEARKGAPLYAVGFEYLVNGIRSQKFVTN